MKNLTIELLLSFHCVVAGLLRSRPTNLYPEKVRLCVGFALKPVPVRQSRGPKTDTQ